MSLQSHNRKNRKKKQVLVLIFLLVTLTLWTGVLALGVRNLPPLGPSLSPFSGLWTAPSSDHLLEKNKSHLEDILSGKASVQFDSNHVIHIFADSDEDLYRAQGFLTASQRLFQLNFMARVAEGKISEWIGPQGIETDIFFQQLDLSKAADISAQKMLQDPLTFKALTNYAEGVNAYIDSLDRSSLPWEFKLFNTSPDQWSPHRSALILKLMTFLLSGNSRDIRLTKTVQKLMDYPNIDIDELFPLYESSVRPSFPSNIVETPDQREPQRLKDSLLGIEPSHQLPLEPNPNNGSNQWAVDSSKSTTGHPLLANDLHLGYQLPAQWIGMHLKSPEQQVIGFSLPGTPGIVVGTNQRLSWGVTNGGVDALDWHKISWANSGSNLSTNPDRQFYLVDGLRRRTQHERRRIRVRSSFSIPVSVTWTHLGPIVDQNGSDNALEYSLAAHWLGAEATTEITSFLRLNRASSVQECESILIQTYTTPQQNFLCVDQKNMGLILAGKIPDRALGQGRTILPTSQERSWSDYLPADKTLRLVNPEVGFLFGANQQPHDQNYPHYLNWSFRPSFRAERVFRFLNSQDRFSPDDLMELQKDTHMIEAEQSLALLLELLNNSQHEFQKTETQYKTYLENWNLKAHKDSIAPTLYHILWEELKSELWSKKLPDPRVYIWPNFEVTLRILRGEIAIDVKPEEVVLKSFMKAVDRLESLENKLWGDYNQAHFPHLLRIPSWGRFVSESGAETTVNAQDKNHGTTLRMVVSMSTPPRVWGLYPGGVSGDPANPSYDKGIKDWTTDRLPEWNFPKSPFDLDSLSLALDLSFEGRRRQ